MSLEQTPEQRSCQERHIFTPPPINEVDVEMVRLWLGIGTQHRLSYRELAERFHYSKSGIAKHVKGTLKKIVEQYPHGTETS